MKQKRIMIYIIDPITNKVFTKQKCLTTTECLKKIKELINSPKGKISIKINISS